MPAGRLNVIEQALDRAASACAHGQPASERWRPEHHRAIRVMAAAALREFRAQRRFKQSAPKVFSYAGRRLTVQVFGGEWLLLVDNRGRPVVGPLHVGSAAEIRRAAAC